MRVIQKGDTVFISETPNLPRYQESAELWWNPFMRDHLGKSGKVVQVRESRREGIIVRVELQAHSQINPHRQTFSWFLEDVSLRPFSKWRRQDLGREDESRR